MMMEVVGWIGRLGKNVKIDGQRILPAMSVVQLALVAVLEGASEVMGRIGVGTGNGAGLLEREREPGQTQRLMTL